MLYLNTYNTEFWLKNKVMVAFYDLGISPSITKIGDEKVSENVKAYAFKLSDKNKQYLFRIGVLDKRNGRLKTKFNFSNYINCLITKSGSCCSE